MKLFAMLMLRCAFIMHLSSLFQNGTLATLKELQTSYRELKVWETSCELHVSNVSNLYKKINSWGNTILIAQEPITLDELSRIPKTKKSLELLLSEVNKFPLKDEMEFPIKEMEELLKRRLKKPLETAIRNCEKLLNEIKQSGLEGNQKYLESLLSKIRSIAKGIGEEFNTFIIEVELELIKQVKWTPGKNIELGLRGKFEYLLKMSEKKLAYCDSTSFINAWSWTHRIDKKNAPQNQKEFVENIEKLILGTKLNILERELSAKIAVFAQQPYIDGDGFIEFSRNFKLEWDKIRQKIDQLTRNDAEKRFFFRKELDFLAKKAMLETAPLKAIITKKLDQLCPGSEKNLFKRLDQLLFKKDQKEEAKKKEIYAMKEIISAIGMFDGAAYKLLVRFEHEDLDNTDFSWAELEKAVEQDKKMISNAYQVKNK